MRGNGCAMKNEGCGMLGVDCEVWCVRVCWCGGLGGM